MLTSIIIKMLRQSSIKQQQENTIDYLEKKACEDTKVKVIIMKKFLLTCLC